MLRLDLAEIQGYNLSKEITLAVLQYLQNSAKTAPVEKPKCSHQLENSTCDRNA